MKAFKHAAQIVFFDGIGEIYKHMQMTRIVEFIQRGSAACCSGSVVMLPVGDMLFERSHP